MELKDGLSVAVLEVLDKDNYVVWSVRIKTYLMAQDLWETVEATSEPPKQEDDEAAFKAWSEKNSMALHVLKDSCGPHALSLIRQISSTKIAWNTLAVVLQVLEKDNYVDWSVRVKTYLMAHDLWDIIEGTTEPPRQEDDKVAFKAWTKKNSTALHVIQISCGPDTFFEIIKISSPKIAWDTLAEKFLQVLEEDKYEEWSVRVKTYLMAHELWDIIEGTMEPPKQEDDEAAFKVWSKKNSTALHVLQVSCGLYALSVIRQINSAKIAWTTLAVVLELLKNKDNYVNWSVRVKTYLIAQDLWDMIEGTTEPPKQEDDEAAFKAWSKKNSIALHVIQISCQRNIFSKIMGISSAKTAWDTLAKKYKGPTGGDRKDIEYEALKKVVQIGEWNAVEEFLKRQPNAANAKITYLGETALHVAVKAGHEHIVEKLVGEMSKEALAIENKSGSTALIDAINKGNYRMAMCMLRKDNNLVSRHSTGKIPVIHAVDCGHIQLTRYLYSLTPLEDLMPEKGSNGATLCGEAIRTETLDIALNLIWRCPRLALALDDEGRSPLYALASMPYLFPSGTRLVFWKQWIYTCIHIQSTSATEEVRLNIQNGEERQSGQVKIIKSVPPLFRELVTNLLNLLGIKDLYEMKLIHVQSLELLDRMCKDISISNIEEGKKGRVYEAFFQAIKKGCFEFVFLLVRANPDLLWACDEDGRNLFMLAVLHRRADIFSLIYGLDEKNVLTNGRDKYGNQILHMAGMTAISTQLDRIPGAALQMQRELQWYKEVERIVHPKVKQAINNDHLTPRQLFREKHKDMMQEGEKWMKKTATSCTVVAGLMITIMFAVAFTVPGGNKQDTGFPVFVNEKLFIVFIVSDGLSLCSSISWIFLFLGILTSNYAEEDFLLSLPRNMMIGLFTVLLSIATMMIAFFAALSLMLSGKSFVVISFICLGSLPVTLFILMQFSLLVNMASSTYGPGIFDRRMKQWI